CLSASAVADRATAETQEGNNTFSRALQVGADLTIASITVPSDAGAGQAITLGDTTRNVGAGAAGPTTTRYYLSSNALLDASDVLLGGRAVSALDAGATDTGSVTLT